MYGTAQLHDLYGFDNRPESTVLESFSVDLSYFQSYLATNCPIDSFKTIELLSACNTQLELNMNAKTTRVRASDDLKEEFSRRLLQKLANRDMTQTDLAREIGVSKDAVSTYARKRSIPSPETLARIAKTLGCEPDELLPVRHDTAALASPLQMKMLQDGRVHVKVDATMSFEQATSVMELLKSAAVYAD